MDADTTGTAVFVAVVAARFLLPLLIPAFPLPAIVACLVLDGIDKSIFELFTTADLEGYQSYDKALDVFYLSIAMLAVLRNWTSGPAAEVARFLFYYRLVGVLLFELVEWRPILMIFPNTFEYFFIFYEVVRSRWVPERLGFRFYVVAAAAIWVFVKLPQEWWIHVAQLDVTDTLKETVFGVDASSSWGDAIANRPLALVGLLVAVAALAAVVIVVFRRKVAPPAHPLVLAAGPLPLDIDEAHERARYVAAHWRVFDRHLFEKIALVALVTVIFGQMLPDVRATPLQLTVGVTVIAVINAFLTLQFARSGRSVESIVVSFALLLATNVGIVFLADALLRRGQGDLRLSATFFFLLLLTLIVTLYDRWRPVYDARFGVLAEAR